MARTAQVPSKEGISEQLLLRRKSELKRQRRKDDGDVHMTLVIRGEGDTNSSASSPIVSDVSGHQRLIENFLEAIETGRQPICDGREGRRSVELIEAVYESSRTGLPVSLKLETALR